MPFVMVPPQVEPKNTPCRPLTKSKPALPAATWYEPCKVGFDVTFALVLLVLTAPLILLAMLLVKLTSRGPGLYLQTRLGRNGVPFTIYKLRTMHHQCEHGTGACWSAPGDPRITRVGRFLRRTHLDELPQLFNVLRGQMSLVGPRPERPEFVRLLEKEIGRYGERLHVRPGVTGFAQVQLPADTDLESVHRKLKYDLYYVDNRGFWLDVRLILSTVFKMLGIPFVAIRALFCFPRCDEIEHAYRRVAVQVA